MPIPRPSDYRLSPAPGRPVRGPADRGALAVVVFAGHRSSWPCWTCPPWCSCRRRLSSVLAVRRSAVGALAARRRPSCTSTTTGYRVAPGPRRRGEGGAAGPTSRTPVTATRRGVRVRGAPAARRADDDDPGGRAGRRPRRVRARPPGASPARPGAARRRLIRQPTAGLDSVLAVAGSPCNLCRPLSGRRRLVRFMAPAC